MATFTNMATLSYSGGVTNSNVVTGELQQTLSLTKTAVGGQYTPGGSITYAVSIVNTGTTAFTGLTLTDDLGRYAFTPEPLTPLDYVDGTVRYYLNGVLQPTPTVDVGTELVFTGLSVPAGGNATLLYKARPNAFAPLGANAAITNSVRLEGETLAAPLEAEATVQAESRPALTISKAVCPSAVAENGQLTYTFVIQNSGSAPADAAEAAVLRDTFDPILRSIAVSFNGDAWTSPEQYTYDETTGEFATVAGQLTVPAATYTQQPDGTWLTDPGVSTLVITGTV